MKSDGKKLIPVIAQDARTNDVLMMAWADAEALRRTKKTGYMHYWSRSRQQLWVKGETSGHVQWVNEIYVDCDMDALLLRVDQTGAACHEGYRSCFFRALNEDEELSVMATPVDESKE